MDSSPYDSEKLAVKRIIALPGDRVTTRSPCPIPTQTVPWGHVWVEGETEDTRKTLDSNSYGPVSMSMITGKVAGVLWPLPWRWIRWEDFGGTARVKERAVEIKAPRGHEEDAV